MAGMGRFKAIIRSRSVHRIFMTLLIVGLAAYFLSLFSDGEWRSIEPAQYTERAMMVSPDCDPVKMTCYAMVDGFRLGLHISGEPKPLKRFQLKVTLEENSEIVLDGIDVQFKMRDMYMGEQQYVLQKLNEIEWQGDIILPVCTSGRSEWTVELLARTGDRLYQAEFPFQIKN